MIIRELDEQECINNLIYDDIMHMYDLIDKCDDCGLCWMDEEETYWYVEKLKKF